MMPRPMTRTQLDMMVCSDPGCTHTYHNDLFFHSVCHPGRPVQAMYSKDTGVLTITCGATRCGRLITKIQVEGGESMSEVTRPEPDEPEEGEDPEEEGEDEGEGDEPEEESKPSN